MNLNTTRGKALQRKAERIVVAKGVFPLAFRAKVDEAILNNDPQTLAALVDEADDIMRKREEFGQGLHEFATKAYTAALGFYAKHHTDPNALESFTRSLEEGGAK